MKRKLIAWMVLRALLLFIMLIVVFCLPLFEQPIIPDTVVLTASGMLIFLFGIAILVAASRELLGRAKFYGRRVQIDPTPERLVVTGLYRFVRHPIYSGIIIAIFGWCLFWGALYCLCILVPIFVVGLAIKALQEERDLKIMFGDEYGEYRRNVGMFFPKIIKKKP